MASGNTLAIFHPYDNEPPAASYATLDTRNGKPILDFDDTATEVAVFSSIVPSAYTSAAGIRVAVKAMMTSAVAGTVGWIGAFENEEGNLDNDADSFATDLTSSAVTVPGTAGVILTITMDFTAALLDSISAGLSYRFRLKRDVTDSSAGDAELRKVHLTEI